MKNIIARVQLNGSLVGDIVLYITSMPTAIVGKGILKYKHHQTIA